VRLLELNYPVDDPSMEVKHGEDNADFASNAIQERRKARQGPSRGEARTGAKSFCGSSVGFFSLFSAHRAGRIPFAQRGAEREKRFERAIELAFPEEFSSRGRPRGICSTFVSDLGRLWAGFAGPRKTRAVEKVREKRA